MPRESLDAPENLPKERRRQGALGQALGQLEDEVAGMSDEAPAGLEQPLLEARQQVADPSPQGVAADRQSTERAAPSVLLEDSVLLHQVLDDQLLMAVDPAGEGYEQQPQWGEVSYHRPMLPRLMPGPGSAEYSDTTALSETSGRGARPRPLHRKWMGLMPSIS